MVDSPVLIYKKLQIIDWDKALHTYTNISFFDDDGTSTNFKWQQEPESEIIDASWKNDDYQNIIKIPLNAE